MLVVHNVLLESGVHGIVVMLLQSLKDYTSLVL